MCCFHSSVRVAALNGNYRYLWPYSKQSVYQFKQTLQQCWLLLRVLYSIYRYIIPMLIKGRCKLRRARQWAINLRKFGLCLVSNHTLIDFLIPLRKIFRSYFSQLLLTTIRYRFCKNRGVWVVPNCFGCAFSRTRVKERNADPPRYRYTEFSSKTKWMD